MKAEELMVGDLVCVNKDVCFKKGTIVEVVGIDSCNYLPEFNLKGSVTCKNTNRDYFTAHGGVWCDFLEPIPLTTEILEKNGFKFLIEDKKYKTLCLNEPYINCTFVKEFKDWMITVGAAGSLKKRFVEVSKVQFVHEMQHLLRLCKYELDLKL